MIRYKTQNKRQITQVNVGKKQIKWWHCDHRNAWREHEKIMKQHFKGSRIVKKNTSLKKRTLMKVESLKAPWWKHQQKTKK